VSRERRTDPPAPLPPRARAWGLACPFCARQGGECLGCQDAPEDTPESREREARAVGALGPDAWEAAPEDE